MREIRSYGSVGVPAGNRRHYPAPRNTLNTRKAKEEKASFPRISRIRRLTPPGFGCGFASIRVYLRSFLLSAFNWRRPLVPKSLSPLFRSPIVQT
jgi:hypothetical protein